MNILGMHFGHDASLSLIHDGRIVSHVLVERHLRVKQAVGIRTEQLETLLADAGVDWSDVDVCTIVSTQDLEILTGLIDEFSLTPGQTSDHAVTSPFADLIAGGQPGIGDMLTGNLGLITRLSGVDAQEAELPRWQLILPEWRDLRDGNVQTVGWLNAFTTHSRWLARRGLEQIRDEPVDPATFSEAVRLGMHYPVTVTLRGTTKPGYFIDHHVCHAASVFYRSGFDQSAVITHDGGDATRGVSGLFCYGDGEKLYVLCPHHLALGGVYRGVGIRLGFDLIGPEGKLMGLSSYGRPCFYDRRFAGNYYDVERRFDKGPFNAWFDHCTAEAAARGYDVDYGGGDKVLNDFCTDVAASTQELFEQGYLQAAECLHTMLANAGRRTTNLCLSGGAALNCPSNTRLVNESAFDGHYIEPNCDDGGLSVGAALYYHHNMLGSPVTETVAAANRSPYQGVSVASDAVEGALSRAARSFIVERPENVARAAARDIDENRLLAWFEGDSEMGPRALCHRSLLANPRRKKNWRHMNAVKGREAWRPLAPVVLEEDMEDWFADCPTHSPYMLYTARVRSRNIPAVTHVDGSARIQTVTRDSGLIYEVLRELRSLSGCSVAINTSLNRPGEPIVETPDQALTLFEETDVDVLYIGGCRISKPAGTRQASE